MIHTICFKNNYSVSVDTANGSFTLTGPNGALGPGVASVLIENEEKINFLKNADVRISDDRLETCFNNGVVFCGISFTVKNGGWLSMNFTIRNETAKDILIEHADFLRFIGAAGFNFGGDPGDVRLLCNPRGMGPYAGVRDLIPKEKPDIYDLGPNRPAELLAFEQWYHSWMVLAVWDKKSRKGAVIGAAQPMHESLLFSAEGDEFRARFFYDKRLLIPGQTVCAPEVQFNLHDRPREGLEAYSDLNKQALKVQRLADYTGWNSFDYYANTETMPDIAENARAIKAMPQLCKQIKWICIDSGWEYRWGEYYALEHRFPGGVSNIAAAIRQNGFEPGLWIAPLMVERYNTRISRWDPDILVHDETGKYIPVFLDNCYVVDPTHPAGEKYLTETFERLYKEGIRYFKCDFLEFGFTAGPRFSKEMSLTDVNRRVLEIIRKAIGSDSFLLACIAAPESTIGICDASRISGDMHNTWSSAQMSAVNIAWRWWMHGKFFWNDPDMIAIRGPETADITREAFKIETPFKDLAGGSGPVFNRTEAETWMTFCLLSGGLFTLSDRMEKLNAAGRRIVSVAIENLSQTAAKPVDFYEPGLPALYLQQDESGVRLGVFNWYQTPQTIRVHTDGLLDIPDGTVLHEIWSEKELVWKGPFDADVPAHGCLFYRMSV